ncbi:hypothetical protein CBG04_07885 [Limosilactobacillus reuteri]|nr:hypothetical protein CBG11_10545 [Limosilactobacillus reuteri]OYS82700.1 hypothetical protein CBG04_07885 [Limosilactobacillus reuteri]OYS84346.1 hypothetical protein CBG14_05670 [Limosilactobacillus reuteri]
MNKDEQVLYDFFCKVGTVNNSVDYPLILIDSWLRRDHESVVADYDKKDEVLEACNHCVIASSLDKPLYEAIKTIKGWE